jgi:hypothetical protein
MNVFDYFHDPFLRGLSPSEKAELAERTQLWGLQTEAFAQKLDNWFCNFDTLEDKWLALKVLHSIKYYTPEAFTERLKQLYRAIERHLADSDSEVSDIVLVTPEDASDSAERHVYDLVKHWGIARNQVISIRDLPQQKFEDPVFVLFNDTHGSGNQFLRDVWPALREYGEYKIYVLAIAISQAALGSFREEMPRVHVIPYIPVENVRALFTGEECDRLEEIGARVYSAHPMGYGRAGLLTAYYFQCPNNTLPIIWADGENNTVNGRSYKWSPLFPYLPKRRISKVVRAVATNKSPKSPKKSAASLKKRSLGGLSYRYRVGLLDIDLGLSNLRQLASDLNDAQDYFHFVVPHNPDLSAAIGSVISITDQQYLSVYEIAATFFAQFDDLAVDVAGCFTRYPLAFMDATTGMAEYNYYSGPSRNDKRFMFISANQLLPFCRSAGCSFEQGLTYILTSQLMVYFGNVRYHRDTRACPMDFCEIRAEMIEGLKVRHLCQSCLSHPDNSELTDALQHLLDWKPIPKAPVASHSPDYSSAKIPRVIRQPLVESTDQKRRELQRFLTQLDEEQLELLQLFASPDGSDLDEFEHPFLRNSVYRSIESLTANGVFTKEVKGALGEHQERVSLVPEAVELIEELVIKSKIQRSSIIFDYRNIAATGAGGSGAPPQSSMHPMASRLFGTAAGPSSGKFSATIDVNKHQAVIESTTEVIVALHAVSQTRKALLTITLPGKEPQEFPDSVAGSIWRFERSGTRYRMTLLEVNYIKDRARLEVRYDPDAL